MSLGLHPDLRPPETKLGQVSARGKYLCHAKRHKLDFITIKMALSNWD